MNAKSRSDLPDEAGQEFDQASKPEKFIRQCGRRHPSNFIVATKKRDAQNGVLRVNDGREFLPSLDDRRPQSITGTAVGPTSLRLTNKEFDNSDPHLRCRLDRPVPHAQYPPWRRLGDSVV
jgi:hypothetical protein